MRATVSVCGPVMLVLFAACSSSPGDSEAGPAGPGSASAAPAGDAPASSDAGAPGDASLLAPTCDSAKLCTLRAVATGYRAVVDAAGGGRVIELSLDGENVLVTKAAEGTAFGSTFWMSPQSNWGWPPIAAVDTGEYTTSIQGRRLLITSSEFTAKGHRLVVQKAFTATRAALEIEYTIRNTGTDALDVAPWEISRVAPGGVTFFPNPSAGSLQYSSAGWTAMPTRAEDGHTFFPYDEGAIQGDRKLFADGGEKGYLAHAKGSLLLVKRWADVPSTARAPGEGEIEIYANAGHTYVELEQQGGYATLKAGESATFGVAWSLVRLPRALGAATVAAGDAATRAMLEQAAAAAASR